MNIRTLSAAVIVVAAVAVAPPARASLLSGTITGIVTSAGAKISGIADGSLVTGSYTYDPSTAFNGLVGAAHPLTAFSLAIGSNPYVFTLSDLQKSSDKAGVVPDDSTSTADDIFFLFKPASLEDFTGGTVTFQSIDNVPPQTYTVMGNAAHSFAFSFFAVPDAVAAVPEPATIALLGLGCLAAIGGRRRGRSQTA